MIYKFLYAIITITLLTSCSGGDMSEHISNLPSIKDVPKSAWEKMAQKKIYFGHQSVGYNIIDGIKDIVKENPYIKLKIVETADQEDFSFPIFAHSKIGKNRDPKLKIDEFETFMEKGIGVRVNLAMLKFCYVDITSDTDIESVFNYYTSRVSEIKVKYPDLTIIHFTVPLTSIETGPKALIKKIIGRSINGINDNIKRNEYNKLLIKKYNGKEPVIDIAAAESTASDGKRVSLNKDGGIFYFLNPAYTDDGGHLNKNGQKVVAEQFLVFIAKYLE